MTKRTDGKFIRHERDFYRTPANAVRSLVPHLNRSDIIAEPCVGGGDLVNALRSHGFVIGLQSDILNGTDALKLTSADLFLCTIFVTNPPWRREIAHPMITHLSDMLPTWLLLDADWMHAVQATPYMPRCRKIVSIGRLKWIPGSSYTGYDNCAWYLFTKEESGQPLFYGR